MSATLMGDALAEGGRLRRENTRMRAALEQCAEYFDKRSDVRDGSYGEPEPNEEMSLLSEIKEALGERP